MTTAKIGRVLVASLHEAIGEVLPARLEFYENWLTAGGLRGGSIGLAPVTAVLSFLRQEGQSYALVMARAGEHAGAWTIEGLSPLKRRVYLALPVRLRVRVGLRLGRALVKQVYPRTRAVTRVRRGIATVELRDSLFCDVRRAGEFPLCVYYAAAFARILEGLAVSARASIDACRGVGETVCRLSVDVNRVRLEREPAAAA